jgi:hypothetical protein
VSCCRASVVATWVDLDRLTPSVLRHLAAAKEYASRPEYDDTEAMAEELAVMVMEGRRPTIGWYQRYRSPATSPPTSGEVPHGTRREILAGQPPAGATDRKKWGARPTRRTGPPALHGVKSPDRLATTSGGFVIVEVRPASSPARTSCSAPRASLSGT